MAHPLCQRLLILRPESYPQHTSARRSSDQCVGPFCSTPASPLFWASESLGTCRLAGSQEGMAGSEPDDGPTDSRLFLVTGTFSLVARARETERNMPRTQVLPPQRIECTTGCHLHGPSVTHFSDGSCAVGSKGSKGSKRAPIAPDELLASPYVARSSVLRFFSMLRTPLFISQHVLQLHRTRYTRASLGSVGPCMLLYAFQLQFHRGLAKR